MSARLNATTVIGGFLILFGLIAAYFGFQIPAEADGDTGARIFPLIGSFSLILMGALELRKGLSEVDVAAVSPASNLAPVLGLLALSVAYLWLITYFGYLIGTAAAAALAMRLFGMRNPLWLLVAAVLCPAIYHLIFFELLGVFPPLGKWFDLLDVIQGA